VKSAISSPLPVSSSPVHRTEELAQEIPLVSPGEQGLGGDEGIQPLPKVPTDVGDQLNCRGDLSLSSPCVSPLGLPGRCDVVLQKCSLGKFGERLGQA